MKHIFIINPAAGQGKKQAGFIRALHERQLPFYLTRSAADCEAHVRKLCSESREPMRVYACGGDGTLHEVVNGLATFGHVEAGLIPLGSGNDFIRNFAPPLAHYRDLDRQLVGQAVDVDLIRYESTVETEDVGGREQAVRYAVNMFNIGFDCAVVDAMSRVKRYPLVKGSFGYLLSIAVVMVKKPSIDLSVEFGDGTQQIGSVLLVAVANGCFCGGGLKGMPRAQTDDGLIDVCIINDVPRRTLVSVLPGFAKGTHLEDKRVEGKLLYKKCESLSIRPAAGEMRICADGNVETVNDVTFTIEKKKLKFVLPR